MDTGRLDIRKWLADISNGEPEAVIARKIGVPQRTFSNHVKSGELKAQEIADIARLYQVNPIYALRDHGLVTDEEINDISREQAAYDIPVYTLLEAAQQRVGSLSIAIELLDKFVKELGPEFLAQFANEIRDDLISAPDLHRVKESQEELRDSILTEHSLHSVSNSSEIPNSSMATVHELHPRQDAPEETIDEEEELPDFSKMAARKVTSRPEYEAIKRLDDYDADSQIPPGWDDDF